jgi:hypothetical protein
MKCPYCNRLLGTIENPCCIVMFDLQQKEYLELQKKPMVNNSYVYDIIAEFETEQDRISRLGLKFVLAHLELFTGSYDTANKYYTDCLSQDRKFSLILLLKGLSWMNSSLAGRKPGIGINCFRQAVYYSSDRKKIKLVIKKYLLQFSEEIIADLDDLIFTSIQNANIKFRRLKAMVKYLLEISVLTTAEHYTLHCQLKDLGAVESQLKKMEGSDYMRFQVRSLVEEINDLKCLILARLN